MKNKIRKYIQNSITMQEKILQDEKIINTTQKISDEITKALKNGNKILFIGNGGSASGCNHLATEFVSKFYKDRRAYNAVSLTSNNALLTALSNDFSYEKAFSRQIEAIGQKGDVLFALSTSGNSENILSAVNIANEMGLLTIGITGENKSGMDNICSILIKIPSTEVPNIQEAQMMLGHIICFTVEEELL